MAQLVIETRAIAIAGTAALVAIAVGATIGYNLGHKSGLNVKQTPSNIEAASQQPSPTPPAPTYTPPAPTALPEEITVTGEPIAVAGKTVIRGVLKNPTAAGFTLETTQVVFNTRTGDKEDKITSYDVKLTPTTQIVEQNTTIITKADGSPQVNTATKKVLAKSLKEGVEAMVTTNDPATSTTVTALEIRTVKVTKIQ